jgi:hypothetical protein
MVIRRRPEPSDLRGINASTARRAFLFFCGMPNLTNF